MTDEIEDYNVEHFSINSDDKVEICEDGDNREFLPELSISDAEDDIVRVSYSWKSEICAYFKPKKGFVWSNVVPSI